MLSLQTIVRLFLSLVLIAVFLAGSYELCIAVATLLSWALGLIAHSRLSLSPTFLRRHYFYILVSFWLLAATNKLFYESTAGRCLDLFFPQDKYDSETPGSGFTEWHETFSRRHRAEIAIAWSILCFAFFAVLAMVSLPLVIAFDYWYVARAQRLPGLEVAIAYLDSTGEYPPWLFKAQVRAPEPESKRDTWYMRLSDDIIFVCGVRGGFERVIAGDYEGAVSRRRGLSKKFA
jgi:hypothetical protein